MTDAAPTDIPGIRFEVEPTDSEIIVDGETLGYASELMSKGALDLVPKIHQIMIRHEEFATARVEVTIAGTTEILQITLQSKSP